MAWSDLRGRPDWDQSLVGREKEKGEEEEEEEEEEQEEEEEKKEAW